MTEMIDIVDENGEPIGEVITPHDAHKTGRWHLAAHIWVYNSEGEVLLQKRSYKVDYGGLWDTSAAGHVKTGEEPKKAAQRELAEELGIKVQESEMEKIGEDKEILKMEEDVWEDKEIFYIFLVRFEGEASELEIQKEEVDKVAFRKIERVREEVQDPKTKKNYLPHEYYPEIFDRIKKEIKDSRE